MINLNLTAKGTEQELVKKYLEENASETLAKKINNGIRIEKDGKVLISKKTLDGFMKYAADEARKLAEKGASSACVRSDVVFGWAIHYFEEDSIDGKLYNEDGSEYNPPKREVKKTTKNAATSVVTEVKKPQSAQLSLFDFSGDTPSFNPMVDEIVDETVDTEVDLEVDTFEKIVEEPKISPLYTRYVNLSENI